MNFLNIEEISFTKSFRGYDVIEVDDFITEIIQKYNDLVTEYNILNDSLVQYKKKEDMIHQTLLKAQEISQKMLSESETDAKTRVSDAEKMKIDILEKAEKEAELYKEKFRYYYSKLEHDINAMLEDFYNISRKYLSKLEKEFLTSIKSKIEITEKELEEITIPKAPPTSPSEASTKLSNQWQNKENSLILGNKLYKDIRNSKNEVIYEKGTIVTTELIDNLIMKGLYGELISSINLGGEK